MLEIDTVDYHTAGEPFRIVTAGPQLCAATRSSPSAATPPSGSTTVRRLLVNEPRGHADMYGCFVTEPEDDGADLGVVFFHNAGYSTACGHGTIALVTWALESGVLPIAGDETRVVVDVPSGRLETRRARRRRRCRVRALPQRPVLRVAPRRPAGSGRRVRRRVLRVGRGARRAAASCRG